MEVDVISGSLSFLGSSASFNVLAYASELDFNIFTGILLNVLSLFGLSCLFLFLFQI